jgi:hypothetical protein
MEVPRRCNVTQTRERPGTETVVRVPVPAEHRTPMLGRWMPWVLGALMVGLAAFALLIAQEPADESFDRVEEIRFEQLHAGRVVADSSHEIAEAIRMAGFAPAESDGN